MPFLPYKNTAFKSVLVGKPQQFAVRQAACVCGALTASLGVREE